MTAAPSPAPIPPRCPCCQGTSFARLRTLYVDVVVGATRTKPDRPHFFTLVVCTGCGKTDWFAQDPGALVAEFAAYASLVEADGGAGPYR